MTPPLLAVIGRVLILAMTKDSGIGPDRNPSLRECGLLLSARVISLSKNPNTIKYNKIQYTHTHNSHSYYIRVL